MLLTFSKPNFDELIKANIKQHTIRVDKNNRWQAGKAIQFWFNNPRNVRAKVKPYQFGIGICSQVEKIEINLQRDTVLIGSRTINTTNELNALARRDGFDNWHQMKVFFDNKTGMFYGKIIYWHWQDCTWL